LNLTGNGGAQSIVGNAGNNVLDGKGGADALWGLGGSDAFVFSSALGSGNVDKIHDYRVVDDTIRLDDAVFKGLALGTLSAGAFQTGATALQADDRIIYDRITGYLYFDPDGVGGTAQVHFATLTSGLAMTSSEFSIF
jgi:Ca2+-binding RTX toxin-like protein